MAHCGLRLQLRTSSASSHAAWAVPPLQHGHPSSRGAHCPPLHAAASASFSPTFGPSSGVSSLLSPASSTPMVSFASRYALGDPLGQGAMGTVVAAIDRVTGQEVAVKVVAKQRNAGRHQRSALHREAGLWKRACAASRQAGRFMSIEEDATNYYIVSEKCHGGSLQQMLNDRGALSEAELSQVAWCILAFLTDMHSNSIYYGDLKPGNVILKDVYPCSSSGPGCLNVRVIDFGCSQIVAPGSPLRALSGSPLFLAPEIIKGSYGLPADMWAFGVTLYLLICNRLPFWLEPVDQLEHFLDQQSIDTAIQYSPVLFASTHWRGVSEDLKDLICCLLEKDPARRLTAEAAMQHPWFANAKEMCRLS
ncbi:hypothetical protein PLESTB_001559600 [Pleodorina starrii]|uniref:Protein kinase domain-containing protein n=1 Tax=Pleodorina starrii TaxID=330485 RepID=A0A9W6BXM3_9CHLO|nr:hypothetical protein PLESTM_001475700 [Pleodorina starrii]GLC59973.1 hypothetical protein PLESTB_001559600 [Pleodorina starrii]GLC72799.1 hypothetical protein PLESTF_001294400 [Pleodorina starrii]